MPSNNKTEFFHDLTHNLIYFDYYLITTVDSIVNKSITFSYDVIIKNILKKLYELYTNGVESELMRIKTINQNILSIIQNSNLISSANAVNIFKMEENSYSLKSKFSNSFQVKDNFSHRNTNFNLNIDTYYMNINREVIFKNIFYFSQSPSLSEDLSNVNLSEFEVNLNNTKNENTLLLSKIDEITSKPNIVDNQHFLNFTDVSQIENVNDNDGNILTTTNISKKTGSSELIGHWNFLAVNDSFLKGNMALFAYNRETLRNPSISNKNKNINSDLSNKGNSKPNLDAGVVTINQNNSLLKKIVPRQNQFKNMINLPNYGSSFLDNKKDDFKIIIFNEKSLHSTDQGLINIKKNLENEKDRNNIYDNEKVKNDINGGNPNGLIEIKKFFEVENDNNFFQADKITMIDRIPTFKVATELEDFSKD